ncbi:unnamed protein product [Ilex paraguariensis]|uniref:Uncharacterized protein n=1 Tax=Ilex paraguariensis TaxID=185542 RepID=A0ABC8QYK5_9AQUA
MTTANHRHKPHFEGEPGGSVCSGNSTNDVSAFARSLYQKFVDLFFVDLKFVIPWSDAIRVFGKGQYTERAAAVVTHTIVEVIQPEKQLDQKRKVKFKIMSLKVKAGSDYVPELYGLGSEISINGDVYSYGICLLEMMRIKRPTDDMFQKGRNLQNFARMVIPDNVIEIVDQMLLNKNEDEVGATEKNTWQNQNRASKRVFCFSFKDWSGILHGVITRTVE